MKKRRLICGMVLATILLCGCQSNKLPDNNSAPDSVTDSGAGSADESTSISDTDQDSTDLVVNNIPKFQREDYPRVDGSTATLPLSYALYEHSTDSSEEEAMANIIHTKTSNSYYELMNGYTDLLVVYEPSEEVKAAMEESDVKLQLKPIGKDALVFMTNSANPVSSLSSSQIVDIYSGKISNWKEVGGADLEILNFQRPVNSGSQTLMEKLVMKGVELEEALDEMRPSSMGDILEDIASYNNTANALGFSVYFYAQNMYQVPGLRFMEVDQVLPANESIKSGEYPYVNDFYAVIREDEPEDSPAHQLFDWLTTSDGQKLIEDLGYVGVQ